MSETISQIVEKAIEEYRRQVLAPAIKELAKNIYNNAQDIRHADGKVRSEFEGGRQFQVGMDVSTVLAFADELGCNPYKNGDTIDASSRT